MSHISKYGKKIKDIETFKRILDANGIPYRENVMSHQYGSNIVQAEVEFHLEGWKYPCSVTKEGEIMYDHFGSAHGSYDKLGMTIRAYNKELVMAKVFGMATNWWEEETKDGLKISVEC